MSPQNQTILAVFLVIALAIFCVVEWQKKKKQKDAAAAIRGFYASSEKVDSYTQEDFCFLGNCLHCLKCHTAWRTGSNPTGHCIQLGYCMACKQATHPPASNG